MGFSLKDLIFPYKKVRDANGLQKKARFRDFDFHATSFLKLQGRQDGLSSSQIGVKSQSLQTTLQARGKPVNMI